jgi:hypothetical protein
MHKMGRANPLRGSFLLIHKRGALRDIFRREPAGAFPSYANRSAAHSHSMVPGGFELMS